MDNGWMFTISGAQKGGVVLWFNADENTYDGYGMTLDFSWWKIQGSYTVGTNNKISGTYQFLDFVTGNPVPNVIGNITGALSSNATNINFTLKNLNNVSVLSMSGAWLNEVSMSGNWNVKISGNSMGTINPLTIEAYQELTDEVYVNMFVIDGSGLLSDAVTPISIHGYFFLTPQKNLGGNTVYGNYVDLAIDGNTPEAGTILGTLNPTTGQFTFNLTSDNGHKYKFVGVKE
jgi:hypothetical protein